MAYEIKYRNEDEMMDSGIEWLGMIPKDWEIISNKYISKINTGGKDTQDRIENGKYPFYVRSETIERINSYSFDGEAILTPGDGDIGGIFHYINGKFDFHQRVYKYSDFKNYSGKYLYYYLKRFLKGKVMGLSAKSTVDSLRRPMLLNFECLYNNLNDQEKIANFLDLKTAEFDSIISKKELLIKKLEKAKKSLISEVVTGKVKIVDGELVERKAAEMKVSGVEWLGMIPKDWEVKRLKHYTIKAGSGKTPRGGAEVYLEEGIPFLRSQNIYNDGLRLDDVVYINEEINSEMSNSVVVKGDILLNITGASIGRCCLYNLDINANVNQHVCIIRLRDKKIFNKLIELLIQSNIVQDYINSFQTGSSREGLNFEQIKNIAMPISKDHNEINSIVVNVNDKVTKLNSVIIKTKLQIKKLKQAKQSLISEAVTGKIDLRDWEIEEI